MFHNFNRDISYILKRVIVGVLIALILGFLSTRKVGALTSNFDSVLMCSNNMGCSTSLSLPYSYAYSDSARLNFTGINLIQGKTYNINFSMTLRSPSFSFNLDYPQLFVIDSSNNPVRAYPDRGNSLQVNNLGNNNYSVNWSFELDNTGGNFTSAYVIFVFTSQYNQNLYSTTINSSNFLYYDLSDPTGNQDIINNQNNNTQNIINNNNSNTQTIINNQNENTEKEIESQKVCESKTIYGNNVIGVNNYALGETNNLVFDESYAISDYLPVEQNYTYTLNNLTGGANSYCLYNQEKTLNSCTRYNNRSQIVFTTSNDYFIRFTINKSQNSNLTGKFCKNGNQAINDSMENINNSINDDNVDTNQANGFFSNFSADNHGLSGIITAPLRLINSLATSTCSPLSIPLPFMNQSATLPCMSTIYSQFPTFYTLWQLITTGLIGYWVLIKIFGHIKGMQNPKDDRIEVLQL